jgi:hypothetical protein
LFEPGLLLEIESEEKGTFNPKILCVVTPNGNKVDAIDL